MQRRQITLPDGRYLIFYTFTAATPPADHTNPHPRTNEPAAAADAKNSTPATQPQAEDEPHV